MSLADLDEIKFAKALVNPDKSVRDGTIASLRTVLAASKNITDTQMLKLWKALFYCMWLADMNPVQMELAVNVAEIIKVFPKPKGALLYIRMFFRTIVREWHHLDQYRLNKFYSLIRSMLHKALEYLAVKKWKSDILADFLEILESEVLVKVPNGVRYHMADIYISEIWNATQGNINTEEFLALLKPFTDALSKVEDKVFHKRIVQRIFEDYLEKHAAHHEVSQERPQIFPNVSTESLQEIIFNSAAQEDTKEGHRKVLYALHRSYQLACQGNILTKAVQPEINMDQSAMGKKIKKKRTVKGAVEAPAVQEEPVIEVEKSAKKRKLSVDEVAAMQVPENVATVEASASKKVRFGKKIMKGISPLIMCADDFSVLT